MQVIKRDGTEKPFNNELIFNAVKQAALRSNLSQEESSNLAATIASKLTKKFEKNEKTSVEDIQDSVEKSLMQSAYKDVARSYIEYRHDRDNIRQGKSNLIKNVCAVLDQSDEDILFENANLNSKTLTTQRTLIVSEVSKALSDNLLPDEVVRLHHEGVIHHHDKNFAPLQAYTNCCLIDLKNMFEKGTKVGGASIDTPKSIGVATAVTAQIISQVSSSQYGGVTIANIDQVLAPYVKCNLDKNWKLAEEWGIKNKELFAKERTSKEVYDAFQALEYEINSLFNSHSQSPFSTLSFGMGTSWEEREIQKAILSVREEGLGKEKITAIFPKLVMFMEEGLNLKPNDPNYDIKQQALRCSSKRMYPDIISTKNNRKVTGSSIPVSPMGKL